MRDWIPPDYRLEYVKQELLANGFSTDPCELLEPLTREVAYALFAPLHEQKQPTYGAIVTEEWGRHANRIPEHLIHTSIDCGGFGRMLADGAGGFAVFERATDPRAIWMPTAPLSGEAALYSFRDDILFNETLHSPHAGPSGTDVVLVQRLPNGSVTILHWDGITSICNGHWSFRFYQYKYQLEEVLERRIGALSNQMKETIRYLLRLCLHVLSPAGCGATVVAALDDDVDVQECLNLNRAYPAHAELSVSTRRHHRCLLHLLAQVDGAMIVGERGNVKHVQAFLDTQSHAAVKTLGGSRQLTAQVTSSRIKSPVLTVSADGPVRVFHRGDLIADFAKPPPNP